MAGHRARGSTRSRLWLVTVIPEQIDLGGVRWQMATRVVDAGLRPVIRRLMGYDERTQGPSERPELPGARVVVILQTGAPLQLDGSTGPQAFVAGLGPGATLTRHDGHQQGVQLDLHPAFARQVFGVPLSELAGTVISLDALLGPNDRGLVEHVAELASWEDRTAAVERWVGERWRRGRRPDPRIAGALQLIERTEGRIDIAEVGRVANLSRPHLARLFREHVGVTPKVFARLRRFEALQERVRVGTGSWSAIAADLGFSDQAHLAREVRALCNHTPTGLAQLLSG